MAQVELVCGPYRMVSLMSSEAADELGLELTPDAIPRAVQDIKEREAAGYAFDVTGFRAPDPAGTVLFEVPDAKTGGPDLPAVIAHPEWLRVVKFTICAAPFALAAGAGLGWIGSDPVAETAWPTPAPPPVTAPSPIDTGAMKVLFDPVLACRPTVVRCFATPS